MPRVAHLLLEKKAKPEIQDEEGNNALHLLAIRMSPNNFYPITGYNTDKNKKDILALTKDIIESAKGTDLLTTRNNKGQLPLQLAIENASDNYFTELAELIIQLGGAESLTEEERDLLVKKAFEKDFFQVAGLLIGRNMEAKNSFPHQTTLQNPITRFLDKLCHATFRKGKKR